MKISPITALGKRFKHLDEYTSAENGTTRMWDRIPQWLNYNIDAAIRMFYFTVPAQQPYFSPGLLLSPPNVVYPEVFRHYIFPLHP